MKKFVLLLCIFLTVSCGAAACGGESGPEPDAPPAEAPAETPAAEETPSADENASTVSGQEDSLAALFSKAKDIEMEYDFTAATPVATIEGKQWIKGKKTRSEMTVEGQSLIVISDLEKREAYNYIPEENMAMKMDITAEGDSYLDPEEYLNNSGFSNAEIIETTTYEGIPCKVVRYKDADGTETKLWVAEEYGIPLRHEETGPQGEKTLIEYKNIKFGSLPDDLFQLPAGVEIMNL